MVRSWGGGGGDSSHVKVTVDCVVNRSLPLPVVDIFCYPASRTGGIKWGLGKGGLLKVPERGIFGSVGSDFYSSSELMTHQSFQVHCFLRSVDR